jgi:hypothetical protein
MAYAITRLPPFKIQNWLMAYAIDRLPPFKIQNSKFKIG